MNGILGTLLRLVEFIIAFGLLVFLHELGHYLMSKLFHIQVEEFGFGFPPRLVKLFQFQETEFTLNWIPFGAFVRPKGENDPNVPGGLAAANPWARLAVLFGGPLMNLIIGVLILSVVFTMLGEPILGKVMINSVSQGSPAQVAGIQKGDIVLDVNGKPITDMQSLQNIVAANQGKEIQITLQRDSKTVQIHVVPRANPPQGQGSLGIVMSNPTRPITWFESLPTAVRTAWDQIYQLVTLPGKLISGKVPPEQGRFVGPVGIYDIYSAVQKQDQADAGTPSQAAPVLGLNTLSFLATISIALGFTNLLPIPALDGGRILFVLPEILFRRRVPAEYENMIHLIGFTVLILLMIYITTQDVIHPVTIP